MKSLADLGANKDKFDGKIYGIEAGNDGNRIIQSMIDDPKNNLSLVSRWSKAPRRAC